MTVESDTLSGGVSNDSSAFSSGANVLIMMAFAIQSIVLSRLERMSSGIINGSNGGLELALGSLVADICFSLWIFALLRTISKQRSLLRKTFYVFNCFWLAVSILNGFLKISHILL